jgi:myosin heavy subunit
MNLINSIFLLNISVGFAEMLLFVAGAYVLGFTSHYYIASRKSLRQSLHQHDTAQGVGENVDWKLKYFNDKDETDASIQELESALEKAQEKVEQLELEVEEMEFQMMKLEKQAAEHIAPVVLNHPEPEPEPEKSATYLQQLELNQQQLHQQQLQTRNLMEQLEALKEAEHKYQQVMRDNEDLHFQLKTLRNTLIEREEDLRQIRQSNLLNRELEERLDKAYREFHELQGKLTDVEKNLARPNSRTIDYESLQEAYLRLTKDYDDLKLKQIEYLEENHRLLRLVAETDDKLREANFQRLQQNKRLSFMEDLNNDLQQINERNKKLELHVKRLSEIENMLQRATREKGDESA